MKSEHRSTILNDDNQNLVAVIGNLVRLRELLLPIGAYFRVSVLLLIIHLLDTPNVLQILARCPVFSQKLGVEIV